MTEYTPEGLAQIGSKWLDRIAAAEKREDWWIKDAERAEKAYLRHIIRRHAGIQHPALQRRNDRAVIYNSTPVPDIRPRHNNKDGAAKLAGEVLERAIATQIDDNRLDAEIERSAQDAFMAGRGVVRIRFDADRNDGRCCERAAGIRGGAVVCLPRRSSPALVRCAVGGVLPFHQQGRG